MLAAEPDTCSRQPGGRGGRLALAGGAATVAACLPAVVLALLLGAGAAQAQTPVKLVSNSGQTEASGTTTSFGYFNGNHWKVAQGFTTGRKGARLSAVDVRLRSIGSSATIKVSIYTTSSGLPSSSLYELSNPASLAANATNTFTAPNDAYLSPRTTYAIVLEEASGGTTANHAVRLPVTTGNGEDLDGVSGWSIANSRHGQQNDDAWGWGSPYKAFIGVHGHELPVFASATVNGTALKVTFDRTLNADSASAGSAFTVTATPQGGSARTINGTSAAVSISGATVSVTLASAAAEGETVTVSYAKPDSSALQDAAGNAVSDFSDQAVFNGTGDTTPPAIVSAAINGATLTITFDEQLDETGSPSANVFQIDFDREGTNFKESTDVSVSGPTATVTFGTAAAHDQVVRMWFAPALNAEDQLKDRAGNAVPHINTRTVETNNTPPAFSSAAVNGTTLTITFDGPLATDDGSVPAAGDFVVTVNGDMVALADTNPVAVAGSTVTLTLATPDEPLLRIDAVTVGYTPGTNKLKDSDNAMNPVPAFSGETVTNNTPADTTKPRFVSATANGRTVTLVFSEVVVLTLASPARWTFVVAYWNSPVNPVLGGIVASGRTVTLTMPQDLPTSHGQRLRVTLASTGLVADRSGNIANTFNLQPVTNNTPPAFSSAAVDGATLTITFNGALDEGSKPAPTAFTVKGAGADQTPTEVVALSGATVTLRLGRRALAGETVTVDYDPPDDNPLRDSDNAMHPVPAFSDRPVTNAGQAPTIDVVRIVSYPTYDADNDGTIDTYIRADQILVDVVFSEPIEVTGGGEVRLRLQVGSNRRVLGTGSASSAPTVLHGGRTLRFSWKVQPGDAAADGVFVHRGADNRVVLEPHAGQKVVSAITGAAADLTTNNLIEDLRSTGDPRHKVDGSKTGGNDVGPRVTGAFVNDTTMAVHFDKTLSTSGVADSRFDFLVRGIAGIGASNPNDVMHPKAVVWANNSALRLILSPGASAGETVTLEYIGTGIRADATAGGRRAPMFRDFPVTNQTGGTAGPAPVRAAVLLKTLELEFSGALKEASAPAGSAFLVEAQDLDDDRRSIEGTGTATVSGKTVTVTLAEGLQADEQATVSYTKPDSNPLQGAGTGNPAVPSFDRFGVGTVVEGVPPKLLGGSVTQTSSSSPVQSKAVLSFDEPLDESSVPAGGDFAVAVSNVAVTISGVAVEGASVVLTLDRLAPEGTQFVVSHTYGTNLIRDVAGNAAEQFTDMLTATAVGNPVFQSAAVDGVRLELAYDKPLDPASLPGPEAFTLHYTLGLGETAANPTEHFLDVVAVRVEGSTAVLRLEHPVFPCTAAFTVTYEKPAISPLQGVDGMDADTLTHRGVTNKRWRAGDNCAVGWLNRAEMGSIILTGTRPFATDSVPRSEWFTVSASGGAVTVTGAAFSADDPTRLKLTLSRDIAAGETVTVSYTRPPGEAGLWNVDGHQLADITNAPVKNDAPEVPAAPGAPTLAQASGTSVEVSWTAPDANPPATGYDVQYRRRGAADWTDHHHAGTATSATIGGLEAGWSWEARVRARNAAGAGAWSEPGAGHTGPARFESAATEEKGRGLILTFTKEILISGIHTNYTVRVDGDRRSTRQAFWEDNTVGLVLTEPVRWGETITVAYAKPSSGAMLHDADELAIESFGPEPVTNTVPRPENSPATGAPTISGTVRVGETLTASTADIEDADGLNDAVFAYQWLSDGADISAATSASYTLADADEGAAIRVRMTFTDDAGHDETLVSAATEPVAPRQPPLTAEFDDVPASHGGQGKEFSFGLRFSENFGGRLNYRVLKDQALEATNGRITAARRAAQGQNQRWTITVRPQSSDTVAVTLRATTDCGAAGAICTPDGRPLSNSPSATIMGPSAGDAVGSDAADDTVALVDEALAVVDGLTPDEARQALFGEGTLSEAQRAALDRLGNRNGRYDLGDVLSWIERCRRGEPRCGARPAGPGAAAGAALLGAAAAGRRRNSGRRRRPRVRGKRRRRGRAGWPLAILLAATTVWSCTGDSETLTAPAAAVPDPGFLTVEFVPPLGNRDIGILLELEGPGIETLRASGLELYQSEASEPHRIIVAGPLRAGPLLRFRVPDRGEPSLYRVRVLEVTDENYGLRDPTEYRAVITSN